MTDLKNIVGVGKVKADKLIELGYADVESLAVLEDAELNADPIGLKIDSINSIRELVGNAASPEVGSTSDQTQTDQETDSVEKPDQTSTPSEDTSEQSSLEDNETDLSEGSTEGQPQESESSQKVEEPVQIEFRLVSGVHKNRVFTWNTGNPAGMFKDGLYIDLSVVSVNVAPESDQDVEGQTRFKFIYGNTLSGAYLETDKFLVLESLLAKKRLRHRR